MNNAELVIFLRRQKWAVVATTSHGKPQSALVGFAVTDALELIFDTLNSTRKFSNIKTNANISLVIGGWETGDERTVQYEGVADIPVGAELAPLQDVYFAAFPDGRSRLGWQGITYIRVRPSWIRYSDFNTNPPLIREFKMADSA